MSCTPFVQDIWAALVLLAAVTVDTLARRGARRSSLRDNPHGAGGAIK
jgi:hypothetical protein